MIEWFGKTKAMRIMEENCDKVTFDIRIENEEDTSFTIRTDGHIAHLCPKEIRQIY